jgi:hypothetical protein
MEGVGRKEGGGEGFKVGSDVVNKLGCEEKEGIGVGLSVGLSEGPSVGKGVGFLVGLKLGIEVGSVVGVQEG